MQTTNSNTEKSTTNLQYEGQDVSDNGGKEADVSASHKASTHMSANRGVKASSNVPSDATRTYSGDLPSSFSQNSRHNSQDGVLQIPSEGGASRRHFETSAWDWNTALEATEEPSSYLYEPQGELLQEQRQQRQVTNEFSIPHAVSPSGLNWSFPASAVATAGVISNEGFAVPNRPSGVPPSVAGSKRKSVTDREGVKQPDNKRSSRVMSDTGEEGTSIEEERPPAHSTRSQGASGGPQRTSTDGPEGQARTSGADVEGAWAQSLPGGSRRTLEDPGIPMVLPARKVFPIQIGDKLFRLSGASISSDGEYLIVIVTY